MVNLHTIATFQSEKDLEFHSHGFGEYVIIYDFGIKYSAGLREQFNNFVIQRDPIANNTLRYNTVLDSVPTGETHLKISDVNLIKC